MAPLQRSQLLTALHLHDGATLWLLTLIFCDDVSLRWSYPTPMLSLTRNTLETHLISLVLSEDLLYPLSSRRPGSGPLSESGPNLGNLGEFRLPSLSTLQVSSCWWGWSNHLKQSAGWACLSRNQGGLVFGRVQPPPKPLHEPSGCSWLQFNPESHLWWSSDQEEELHISKTPLRYIFIQNFIGFKSEPEKLSFHLGWKRGILGVDLLCFQRTDWSVEEGTLWNTCSLSGCQECHKEVWWTFQMSTVKGRCLTAWLTRLFSYKETFYFYISGD